MLDLKLLIKTNINDKVDSNVSCILHATCTSRKKLKEMIHSIFRGYFEFSHRLYE